MSTSAHFTEALLARGRAVKVLLLDVDGVLTDGGLLYSAQGETLKRFNTLDGHGLKMLQSAGVTVAVITGRDSEPLRARLAALGDWPDWPMMKDAALRCAPANAHHEIMSRADFATRSQGGHGAVREVCDLLLSATGHYQTIAAKYAL
jgi:3-deoxy-D-manno-octulosonate 8-phosphate phosphatase (KDO 8-P phosphatase)